MLKKLFLLFIILYSLSVSLFSQKETISSVEKKLKLETLPESKVDLMLELFQLYNNTDSIKAKQFLNSAYNLSVINEYLNGEANTLYNFGDYYYSKSNFQLSNQYYQQSIEKFLKLQNKVKAADAFVCIGTNYDECSVFEKGLESYIKAEKLYSEIKDTAGLFSTTYNIGCSYYALKNLTKAKQYINKAFLIAKQLNDKSSIAYCYSNLGIYERKSGNYEKALSYYIQLETLAEELKDSLLLSTVYNNIGNIFNDKNELVKARQFFLKGLEISKKTRNNSQLATIYSSLGILERKRENYSGAIEYLTLSNNLFLQINSPDRLMTNYKALSEIYNDMNDLKKAYMFQSLAYTFKDSLYSVENLKLMTDMETKYQTEKKEQQLQLNKLEIEQKNREVKQQRLIIIGIAGVLIIIILFSALLFRLFKQKKKANIQLSQKNNEIQYKNEEISAQRDEIQAQRDQVIIQRDMISVQQKKITDSIQYARKIQTAVLPPDSYVKEIFPSHFILYKPRDIVSGDFYWIKQIENRLYFAVADCTGHGVPGAFMSMMGVAFLNEIVIQLKNPEAGQILDNLRNKVKNSLHQTGRSVEQVSGELSVKDGMDISLCIFDKSGNEIQFAGANNPVYIVRKFIKSESEKVERESEKPTEDYFQLSNFQLYELKGDKMPIGIHVGEEKPFTTQVIKVEKGTMIYLFSDGYADQFEGPAGKKFLYSRLKQLLIEISNKQVSQQRTILEHTIEKWMADTEQVDDILIIGIQIV